MHKSPSKSPDQPQQTEFPTMEAFRKLKRLTFFVEPSLAFLGFFLATVCIVLGFFYLDYSAVVRGFRFPFPSQRFQWLQFYDGTSGAGGPFPSSSFSLYTDETRADYLTEAGGGCDVFDGDWVWDQTYPLYLSKNCPFLDQGFRCSENGRPDSFYTNWRWQPKACNLPRFDAKVMLDKLRNKRVVFAGDSIGRNQWESLLCLLAPGVSNQSSIYEVNGNPITKHKGYLVFKFDEYNCTVEYYRAPFLVLQSRPPEGVPISIKTTLKLDQMDWNAAQWKSADLLVLNTGHWWNYEKTIRGGSYFQEGDKIDTSMEVDEAYRRSIDTVIKWIDRELNATKTRVYFRTYAPVHFRGGDWRTGGSCHMETLPDVDSSLVPTQNQAKFTVFLEALSAHSHLPNFKRMNLLNITEMTSRRKDAHLSLYYLGPKVGPASVHRQDCSHWCLPGVPDTWNELLYAIFLKHELLSASSYPSVSRV